MKTINSEKFNAIVKREEEILAQQVPHTTDGYNYQNRVALLKEIEALITEPKAESKPVKAKVKVEEPEKAQPTVKPTEETEVKDTDKAITAKSKN